MVICAEGYEEVNGRCVPIKGVLVVWDGKVVSDTREKSTIQSTLDWDGGNDPATRYTRPGPPSKTRFAISGHSREKWFDNEARGKEDLTEFLTCVKDEFPNVNNVPSVTLVAGDATGVDSTGAEILENLGGNVVKVPHDTFSYPTSRNTMINAGKVYGIGRNESMLKGGYETTDSLITKLGLFGEHKFGVAKGSKVKGRKKAPLHTSPWVDFLAFWRYMKSPGTQETESQARAAKIPTCDLYHKGGKACCEQMRGIF